MRWHYLLIFLTYPLMASRICLGQEVLYCFDFGGAFQDVAPGYTAVSRVYHSPRYLWIDNVREVERMDVDDPLRRDFVGGAKGEFWIGLDNGRYQITVILGDPREAKGPFDIYLQEEKVQSDVLLAPGQTQQWSYPATVRNQKLVLRLQAAPEKEFAINGLIISGESGKAMRRLFKHAPPDDLPSVDEVLRKGSPCARTALRTICDWLLSHQLANGFLGDYEPGRKGTHFYWYTSAYPIRALLAGYDILGEKKYLDIVFRIMDSLVKEQLPNGAWQQIFRNKPPARLSQQEFEDIYAHEWMNLADIGCIATALGMACQYAAEPRKSLYGAALQRFCDEWAVKWQQPSGGFSNAMESGVARTEEYSTATATEAAAFTALFIQTKDKKYLKVAEKAAHFMTDHWNQDGRPTWFNHAGTKEGLVLPQPVHYFGEAFYYIDGLFMVYHHTEDQALKEKIGKVYGWNIHGDKGLLVHLGQNAWWPLQDAWNNSKTAGMPLAFLNYQRMVKDPAVDRFVSIAKRFLCTREFSQRLGIMVEDAEVPWGGHSLQTWAACCVSAPGFAGLSIAEMVRPGVIYQRPNLK